jgi:hypothetical protein
VAEKVVDMIGILGRRAKGDLLHLKESIEERS